MKHTIQIWHANVPTLRDLSVMPAELLATHTMIATMHEVEATDARRAAEYAFATSQNFNARSWNSPHRSTAIGDVLKVSDGTMYHVFSIAFVGMHQLESGLSSVGVDHD